MKRKPSHHRDHNTKAGQIIRWVLLAPVLPMSMYLSGIGFVGLGFGAGPFLLGALCALPAFLLNFVSSRWGLFGAGALLLLDYVPRAILNWPNLNPSALLSSKADAMLVTIFALTAASAIASRLISRMSSGRELRSGRIPPSA